MTIDITWSKLLNLEPSPKIKKLRGVKCMILMQTLQDNYFCKLWYAVTHIPQAQVPLSKC